MNKTHLSWGTTHALGLRAARLPRGLHPVAWWLWALALATAASRTSNPLLLVLIFAVLGFVVTARRTEAPWAKAFHYYLIMALIVIAIRVVFRSVFASGITPEDHILFRLPQLQTPDWYAGIQIGGPVSLEATLSAALDGLRLACLLCCIGAANSLANPKRALKALPGALYELGVAVTVALSVAPQLVESVQRVARARRLRAGRPRGLRAVRAIALPVLHDALDRSLRLAAAMDARGYGRTGTATRASRRLTGTLMLAGMAGLCVGVYGLLDPSVPRPVGLGGLAIGVLLSVAGLATGGRRVARSRYRPDRWQWPELVVAGSGLITAVVLAAGTGYDPAELNPGLYPLSWPTLPPLPTAAILVAATAAFAAPPPPQRQPPTLPAGAHP
ncbi:CbiQ family ECF transporter T component [Micromonospora rubida]|uniref:CbiQ family ECF transporter T component n=1 Tax=Micromonospora rubida TaxID=2697657 RepID=UPI001378B8BC|nr:CbiQ family ECF transporter T component [Micromonospora rubida]NBE83385.1 energy-coupling factor transporter transmembrane protein EcfT [Micromonospora rubida]